MPWSTAFSKLGLLLAHHLQYDQGPDNQYDDQDNLIDGFSITNPLIRQMFDNQQHFLLVIYSACLHKHVSAKFSALEPVIGTYCDTSARMEKMIRWRKLTTSNTVTVAIDQQHGKIGHARWRLHCQQHPLTHGLRVAVHLPPPTAFCNPRPSFNPCSVVIEMSDTSYHRPWFSPYAAVSRHLRKIRRRIVELDLRPAD